ATDAAQPAEHLAEAGQVEVAEHPQCLTLQLGDLAVASWSAARTRSWSISTSSGSTTSGEMVTPTTSPLPVIRTVTTPPPAVPSTSRFTISAWADTASWAEASSPPRSPRPGRPPAGGTGPPTTPG